MSGLQNPIMQLFIAGGWRDAGAGTAGDRVNPSTDDILAPSPRASTKDLDHALAAVDSSFRTWGRAGGSA